MNTKILLSVMLAASLFSGCELLDKLGGKDSGGNSGGTSGGGNSTGIVADPGAGSGTSSCHTTDEMENGTPIQLCVNNMTAAECSGNDDIYEPSKNCKDLGIVYKYGDQNYQGKPVYVDKPEAVQELKDNSSDNGSEANFYLPFDKMDPAHDAGGACVLNIPAEDSSGTGVKLCATFIDETLCTDPAMGEAQGTFFSSSSCSDQGITIDVTFPTQNGNFVFKTDNQDFADEVNNDIMNLDPNVDAGGVCVHTFTTDEDGISGDACAEFIPEATCNDNGDYFTPSTTCNAEGFSLSTTVHGSKGDLTIYGDSQEVIDHIDQN